MPRQRSNTNTKTMLILELSKQPYHLGNLEYSLPLKSSLMIDLIYLQRMFVDSEFVTVITNVFMEPGLPKSNISSETADQLIR
ncbi:MAG: hypothetical protein QXJ69_01580 [Desulfurococcaceae archaeon]